MEQRSCDPTHLVAGVATALGVWRRRRAQLDGLRLMEDDGGQRLLPQRQHVEFGLQHGLEVLRGKERRQRQHKKQHRSAKVSVFAACCVDVAKPELKKEEEALRAGETEEFATKGFPCQLRMTCGLLEAAKTSSNCRYTYRHRQISDVSNQHVRR